MAIMDDQTGEVIHYQHFDEHPLTRHHFLYISAKDGGEPGVAVCSRRLWFAAGSHRDQSVRLWDVGQDPFGDFFASLQGFDGRFLSVAFSPDRRWLAGGAAKGPIYLWELVP
jgi:WD40 repeat protein